MVIRPPFELYANSNCHEHFLLIPQRPHPALFYFHHATPITLIVTLQPTGIDELCALSNASNTEYFSTISHLLIISSKLFMLATRIPEHSGKPKRQPEPARYRPHPQNTAAPPLGSNVARKSAVWSDGSVARGWGGVHSWRSSAYESALIGYNDPLGAK